MNYDDYLVRQAEEYYREDENVYTQYTLEIYDSVSYRVYAEDLNEDELLQLLKENDIEITDISREYINVCEVNGVNVQITPHSESADPTDI